MRRRSIFAALIAASLLPDALHAATPAQTEVSRYAESLLADTYPADGPGAALLVARADEVLYRGARGEADLDRDVPLTADSMFRIGSLTKQFAAAGLLKLIEADRVRLDDPLARHLPNYPNGHAITVRELLNHTSGVKSFTSIPGYLDGPIRRDITTDELVDVFDDLPPDFTPGEGWHYTNSGYVLIGAVIESVTGMSWHQYLQQALFTPLGMTHTGWGADPQIVAHQAKGYTQSGSHTRLAPALSMTQPHAAGSLVSNVGDLQAWNRALHEGRVLRSDTYLQMVTPSGQAAAAGYGFGLYIDNVEGLQVINHGGVINGFSAMLLYVPGADVSVVVLQNRDGAGQTVGPQDIAREMALVALTAP